MKKCSGVVCWTGFTLHFAFRESKATDPMLLNYHFFYSIDACRNGHLQNIVPTSLFITLFQLFFCKWSNANFAQTIKLCKWPSSTSHVCKFFFSLKRYFEHCSLGTLPRELYLFLSQLKFQTNLFFAPFSLFLYSLIPIRQLISNPSK